MPDKPRRSSRPSRRGNVALSMFGLGREYLYFHVPFAPSFTNALHSYHTLYRFPHPSILDTLDLIPR